MNVVVECRCNFLIYAIFRSFVCLNLCNSHALLARRLFNLIVEVARHMLLVWLLLSREMTASVNISTKKTHLMLLLSFCAKTQVSNEELQKVRCYNEPLNWKHKATVRNLFT
jgi:hypothetical protein